jgi:hypothetical protein
MDTDLFLVLGISLCVIAIPAMLNAFVAGVAPRTGGTVTIGGLMLIVFAVTMRPGGYTFAQVPTAFEHVINRITK